MVLRTLVALLVCADAVRWLQEHDPSVPEIHQPEGYHLQYKHDGRRVMSEISCFFAWLSWLGNRTNATVHLQGGMNGTSYFLNPNATGDLAANWSRYFDVTIPGHPFHDLLPQDTPCVRWDKTMKLGNLFHDDAHCVIVESTPFEFMSTMTGSVSNASIDSSRCLIWENTSHEMIESGFPPSAEVKDRFRKFRLGHNIPAKYGFALVRNCNKKPMNCSDPELIKKKMLSFTDINFWVVNLFTGEFYDKFLRQALSTMNKTILYDDSFSLSNSSDTHWRDEYFDFEMWQNLRVNASGVVTLDECNDEEVHMRATMDEHEFHLKEEIATKVSNGPRGHFLYHKTCKEKLTNSSGLPAKLW